MTIGVVISRVDDVPVVVTSCIAEGVDPRFLNEYEVVKGRVSV